MGSRSYTQVLDVGNVTATTVSGLADCTTWYFVVKSYDTQGYASNNYSNEVASWPAPLVASTSPSAAAQGRALDVAIGGSNFVAGSTVRFGSPGITVNSVTVSACGQLTAAISVSDSAPLGPSSITVTSPNQASGTGLGLFTVRAATTPPSVSAVQSGSVGATRATITWTTDEPADSQVLYRKSGQTGYQQTEVDSTLGTAHAVVLEGLDPASTYQAQVRSADAAGNAAISSPDLSFATSASSYAHLRFETECGNLVSPVQMASGVGMFDSGAITTPAGTPIGGAANPAGTASYGIDVPTAGTWYLWVRVFAQDAQSSSWFESVDGAGLQPVFASRYGAWTWIAGGAYALTQGLHAIELGGYDAQAMADRILLTDDRDFVPTEQPVDDQIAPEAPVPFTATPGSALVSLSWRNPRDTDFQQTVIRCRTDGSFPTSPVDGHAVTAKAGNPGSQGSLTMSGLVNGITYSFSAFAVDRSGNVSVAAHAQAVPDAKGHKKKN
ncbi:MAG: fibronectin type III domain-containing protein [Acidobacteriia bacterium]|nr:fibronectin type III domain-containing protein [Terriglobia bacterium]